MELLFNGEENRQRVERVDAGLGEDRFAREGGMVEVFLFADDLNQRLLDLVAGHRAGIIRTVFARPRRFWPLYAGWIAICAVLFFALRGLDDPSRRPGRILSTDAERRAVEILRARDARFQDFEVIHVAWARAGEGAAEERWVVLADRVPRTALREAVVVELRATDGSLLRIRGPAP